MLIEIHSIWTQNSVNICLIFDYSSCPSNLWCLPCFEAYLVFYSDPIGEETKQNTYFKESCGKGQICLRLDFL